MKTFIQNRRYNPEIPQNSGARLSNIGKEAIIYVFTASADHTHPMPKFSQRGVIMIRLLIRLATSRGGDEKTLRTRCGMCSGIVGIVLNIILFTAKFIAGRLSGSIAITADAFNNLSDAASCSVNVFGFKLSSKPADEEHPFGHGRLEYICAMIVTFLVLIMGYELASSSFEKILHPQSVTFSYISMAILIVSILGKLWLAMLNKTMGKKIHSPALEATAADSFGDMAATGATLVSLILSKFTTLPLDGYFGLGVAIFIFIAGIRLFKESSDPLLGQPPEKELIDKIVEKVMSYEGVVGVHDLMLHDYGPGRLFGSVHAEVPSTCDIMEIHDTIDLIEQEIRREFDVLMVIHLDPIVVDDETVTRLRTLTQKVVESIDESLTIHDFRMVEGPSHTNLIFDLVTPHKFRYSDTELVHMVEKALQKENETYFAVIQVERNFV